MALHIDLHLLIVCCRCCHPSDICYDSDTRTHADAQCSMFVQGSNHIPVVVPGRNLIPMRARINSFALDEEMYYNMFMKLFLQNTFGFQPLSVMFDQQLATRWRQVSILHLMQLIPLVQQVAEKNAQCVTVVNSTWL